MTRLARAAARQPSLYPFGSVPLPRMSAAEEATAPFEARLRASWPYIVNRARRFVATLTHRERAHLSEEDLTQAIVATLLQRDGKFDIGRGRYVTFVENVSRNVIVVQREKARVVTAPANAVSRLRKLRAKSETVGLSKGQKLTMSAIERALSDTEELSHREGPEAPREAVRDDAPGRDLMDAMKAMESPVLVAVMAWSCGLFGQPELNDDEIAARLPGSLSAPQVRALQGKATRAMRARIERLKGPKDAQ